MLFLYLLLWLWFLVVIISEDAAFVRDVLEGESNEEDSVSSYTKSFYHHY